MHLLVLKTTAPTHPVAVEHLPDRADQCHLLGSDGGAIIVFVGRGGGEQGVHAVHHTGNAAPVNHDVMNKSEKYDMTNKSERNNLR